MGGVRERAEECDLLQNHYICNGRALDRLTKQKHRPNRQKLSKKYLKIVFSAFSGNFSDIFRTFFDIFFFSARRRGSRNPREGGGGSPGQVGKGGGSRGREGFFHFFRGRNSHQEEYVRWSQDKATPWKRAQENFF